ncbi:molecular chaperone HtpG, partial [Buchnera aphidicola (Hormaphis cornu)]
KKTYIMDDAEQFLPNYLRFVKGIIDSNNLPLNISREILQSNQIISKIRQSITKRILNLLLSLKKNNFEKYYDFWKQFGIIIKEGPAEDPQNKELILNLLLFTSLNTNSNEQKLSLKEYVKKMPDKQEKIYYITADSYESAKSSPNLEIFRSKKIDVLLLSERIDEWMMNYLSEFEGIKFQSASKSDNSINKLINVSKNSESLNKSTKKLKPLLEKIQMFLDKKIKKVQLTYRLIDTPAIVITDANDMSTQMAKLFSAAGQSVPDIKYILEINPNHALIKKISQIKEEKILKEWIMILFDQALLTEKGSLENPNLFISRINHFLLTSE